MNKKIFIWAVAFVALISVIFTFGYSSEFVDTSGSDFNAGDYNQTEATDDGNVIISVLSGNDYYISGDFNSQVFNAGGDANWVSILWNEGEPYGDAISDTPSGAVAFWRMEEGTGNVIADSTGNGNTANALVSDSNTQLLALDTETGWAASLGDSMEYATDPKVEGTGAISLNKGAASGRENAYMQKAIDQVLDDKQIYVWVYAKDQATADKVRIIGLTLFNTGCDNANNRGGLFAINGPPEIGWNLISINENDMPYVTGSYDGTAAIKCIKLELYTVNSDDSTATGDVVFDDLGFGNSFPNGAKWSKGVLDSNAFESLFQANMMAAADSATLDQNGDQSYEFWIKPDFVANPNYATRARHLIEKCDTNGYYSYFYENAAGSNSEIEWRFYDGTNLDKLRGDMNRTETWHHVVVTLDRLNEAHLWIDGADVNSITDVTTGDLTNDANFYFSEPDNSYGTPHFTGAMDDIAIYNTVLSEDEIIEHYKRGKLDLKLQVRSCSDATCSTNPDFVGSDGTSATYFTNGSTTHYLDAVSDSQYFQYRAVLETDDANSLKGMSPHLLDATITYSLNNQAPDINITKIDSNPDDEGLPPFSYYADLNLTIDFNVMDADGGDLNVDINYSSWNTQGTGTVIVDDLNLSTDAIGAACDDNDFTDSTKCSYDWNISGVTDGNYYIIVVVSDGTVTDFNTSDNNFMVENTNPDVNADYNTSWQTFDANIILACTDANSGCDTIYYRVDTDYTSNVSYGSWQTYDANILITADGNTALDFNASDKAGNYDDTNTIYILIDTTAPDTNADYNSNWQNFDANVVLACTDGNGSGCATTKYRLDSDSSSSVSYGSWQTFDANILLDTDGNYAIDFNSTDNVGYVEDTNTVYVLVDKTTPSTVADYNTGWQNFDSNVF